MIVYASRTGNVRNIVSRINHESIEMDEGLLMDKPYVLITYTDGLGDIPERVEDFLSREDNADYLKGVVASGNMNFGDHFCKSGVKISNQYNVPLIAAIDLRGTNKDIVTVVELIKKILE